MSNLTGLRPTSLLLLAATALSAQELQPRAYVPAPLGLRFATISYANDSGGLLFDASVPIEDGQVRVHAAALAVGGSVGVFGRSAQVLAVLPYAVADVSGRLGGVEQSRHRSGLTDSTFRFAINIHGAPAMHVEEFAKFRPRTVVGASVTALAPTGQYDPNLLINIGTNRWAFKPEIGLSHLAGKWAFEGALGTWLFTKNGDYYGGTIRRQDPLGSVQVHVVRLLPHRMWAAFDGTYYMGGRTSVGNTIKADYISNTRFGATFGIAIARRQALRFAYFNGVTTRFGSDISSISVSYQVLWQRGQR
jgi:hypothetical protein